jgi:hypothetical protein
MLEPPAAPGEAKPMETMDPHSCGESDCVRLGGLTDVSTMAIPVRRPTIPVSVFCSYESASSDDWSELPVMLDMQLPNEICPSSLGIVPITAPVLAEMMRTLPDPLRSYGVLIAKSGTPSLSWSEVGTIITSSPPLPSSYRLCE